MILPAIASNYQDVNCFEHLPQSSTYQILQHIWLILVASNFQTKCLKCIYHLLVRYILTILHSSQWNFFPTKSSLVLYFFCVNLLYSPVIMSTVTRLSSLTISLFIINLSFQYCYYCFTSCNFFPTIGSWGFFYRCVLSQQVFSGLQNSSQYSGWS